ncbi:MAG: hypothetical protein AABX54_01425 [Nanoarchaeota archaeon]
MIKQKTAAALKEKKHTILVINQKNKLGNRRLDLLGFSITKKDININDISYPITKKLNLNTTEGRDF